MRIGLVSQEYPPESAKGGIGTQTFIKARELAALGHEIRVISRQPEGERAVRQEGNIEVIRIPSGDVVAYTELADWLSYSQALMKEIALQHARLPFDILDFPEWACESYSHLLNQTQWNRIPTVIQLHGPLIMLARTLGWPDPDSEFFRAGMQMEATTLRLANAVYSSSACSADWCAREYGLDRKSIPVLHTGIDLQLFHALPLSKAAHPTIIFVGKMVRNKGVEILVDAACNLARDFPDLRLRLLGGGEDQVKTLVRQKVSDHGLERMLDMPGYVDRKSLPEHLSRAHIFAAPSRYEGGPGFVYLEAMACGLPVIGCQGSGAAEVIRDGETGFLVPPGDAAALEAALRNLLEDGSRRAAMGKHAQEYVGLTADSRNCVASIAAFYQQVIDQTGVSAGPSR